MSSVCDGWHNPWRGPQLTLNDKTTLVMVASGSTWVVGESRVTESEALEAVKLALELAAGDVNTTNASGDTALHASAYMGADSIVQFLVDKGAKVNVENNDGVTPFMIADGKGPRVAATNIHNPGTAELLRKLGGESQ